MAYRITLPPLLARVHNVFNVLMLQEYVPDPAHVLESLMAPLCLNATYEEYLIYILENKGHQV